MTREESRAIRSARRMKKLAMPASPHSIPISRSVSSWNMCRIRIAAQLKPVDRECVQLLRQRGYSISNECTNAYWFLSLEDAARKIES